MGNRIVTLDELAGDNVLEIGAGRPRSEGTGLPVLKVADVLEGRVQAPSQTGESTISPQMMGPKVSRPGDVVLTTKGTVGRVAIMPSGGPTFAYSPQLCYFRPVENGPLHSRYLYYWFKSPEFSGQAAALKGQTDMADFMSLRDMTALTMTLPNVMEQRAIAEVLGALDDKIAANDTVASKSTDLAELHYKRAVVGKARRAVSSALEPVLGGTPPRTDDSMWGGLTAWASAKDITGAPYGVVIETSETISERAARNRRTSPLPAGTVILTARGTVGVVARLGIPAAINQSCYGFIPGSIPKACLYFAVKEAADQAKAMAHGSVFDTITMRTFDHMEVPDLCVENWKQIEELIGPLLRLSQQQLAESAVLEKTRDELLPLLMSGKVRVRDAEKVVEEIV